MVRDKRQMKIAIVTRQQGHIIRPSAMDNKAPIMKGWITWKINMIMMI